MPCQSTFVPPRVVIGRRTSRNRWCNCREQTPLAAVISGRIWSGVWGSWTWALACPSWFSPRGNEETVHCPPPDSSKSPDRQPRKPHFHPRKQLRRPANWLPEWRTSIVTMGTAIGPIACGGLCFLEQSLRYLRRPCYLGIEWKTSKYIHSQFWYRIWNQRTFVMVVSTGTWLVSSLNIYGYRCYQKVLALLPLLVVLRLQCLLDQLCLLLFATLGRRYQCSLKFFLLSVTRLCNPCERNNHLLLKINQTHVSLLIDGDFLDFGLDLRLPRRIHHRQRLNANFRRWQSELDTRRWNFEGGMGSLLHPRPNLESQFPQNVKPQNSIDPGRRIAVLQTVEHQLTRLIRGSHRSHYEQRSRGSCHFLIRLQQQLPSNRQNVYEQILRHNHRTLHQRCYWSVKGILHLWLDVLQYCRWLLLPITVFVGGRLLAVILATLRLQVQVFARVSLTGETARLWSIEVLVNPCQMDNKIKSRWWD